MGLLDKEGSELNALYNIKLLLSTLGTSATLESILNNVSSKIERIKGSSNYSRSLTYHGTGTLNVTVITHTGTTLLGVETVTETLSYVNAAINGSNVTGIVYT